MNPSPVSNNQKQINQNLEQPSTHFQKNHDQEASSQYALGNETACTDMQNNCSGFLLEVDVTPTKAKQNHSLPELASDTAREMALLDTARLRIMISSISGSVRGGDWDRLSARYESRRAGSAVGAATAGRVGGGRLIGGGTEANCGFIAGGRIPIGGGILVLMPDKLVGGGTNPGGGTSVGGSRGGGAVRRMAGGGIPGGGTFKTKTSLRTKVSAIIYY